MSIAARANGRAAGRACTTEVLEGMMVAEDGAVRLFYIREQTSGLYDAVYEESLDGGATWSAPFALNTAPLCTCFGHVMTPERAKPMFGHTIALDARTGTVVGVWPDQRDPASPQTAMVRVGSYAAGP